MTQPHSSSVDLPKHMTQKQIDHFVHLVVNVHKVKIPLIGTEEWYSMVRALQAKQGGCLTRSQRKAIVKASNACHGADKADHGKGKPNNTGRAIDQYRQHRGHLDGATKGDANQRIKTGKWIGRPGIKQERPLTPEQKRLLTQAEMDKVTARLNS